MYSVLVKPEDNKSIENILKINNYHYQINQSEVNSLYKREFKNLKANLENSDIDYDEYVKSVAKLYIIDLYSLTDKQNKYDVTSSQYVYEPNQENFKLKVSETLYKYIKDNTNNDRDQELPKVSEIFINDVVSSSYVIDNNEYDAYIINISWVYGKDLGYDTTAKLTLVNINDLVSVVEENRMDVIEDNTEPIKNS